MLFEVAPLLGAFLGRKVGNGRIRPYLAVWVRVGTPHHCFAILEYLHVVDEIIGAATVVVTFFTSLSK